MIWILIVAVVLWLFFKFTKEQNKHIASHVTNYGGNDLLLEFLKGAGMQITKMGKNNIELKSNNVNCLIYYIGTNLEVLLVSNMPQLGCQKKKWVFPDGYPQEKMIEEIDNYATWQVEQMLKASENNQYIDYDERY